MSFKFYAYNPSKAPIRVGSNEVFPSKQYTVIDSVDAVRLRTCGLIIEGDPTYKPLFLRYRGTGQA